jgi:hypothetical protein
VRASAGAEVNVRGLAARGVTGHGLRNVTARCRRIRGGRYVRGPGGVLVDGRRPGLNPIRDYTCEAPGRDGDSVL